MAIGIDPTNDYAFKKISGDPAHTEITIHALNAAIAPVKRIENVQIRKPFLEKDFEEDKLGALKILADDESRRRFNIEMQSSLAAGLP